MHKWLIIGLAVVSVSLAGCSAVNQTFTPPPDFAQTSIEPMSAMEYTNKVDSMLIPLLGQGETLLAHSINLTMDRFPAAEEVPLVENLLDATQTTAKAVDALYPPPTYVDHKTKTVLALTTYKNALERYREALLAQDPKAISTAADGLKIAAATLKGQYDLYSR